MAYIDCDPGQCEFTISGCITLSLITEPLLGPPHAHINHNGPSRQSYFLGHISPSDAPGHYMDCVRQCQKDFQSFISKSIHKVPLIVNTMGWNQGLGLCLLKEKILLFKPTHIIQINHSIEVNKNMPTLNKTWLQLTDGYSSRKEVGSSLLSNQNPNQSFESEMETDKVQLKGESYDEINYKLITLKSGAPSKTSKFPTNSPQQRFSPKDHRNIAILTYFSRLQEPKLSYKLIHFLRPYRVPWSKFALHVAHTRVDFDQLLRVLNTSLVGLCSVQTQFVS